MKPIEIIIVNLDLSPKERWNFAEKCRKDINELIQCYWRDIENYIDFIEEYLEFYKQTFISTEYLDEIQSLAQFCDFSENQLLIVNLYYDVIKLGFACSAFAFEKDNSIWHARNLDWWTENQLLAKHTKVFEWQKGGEVIFKSVGWIGFIGVLSGMKPNRFAVTLNAVLSEETPSLAKPISFLLREILQADNNFKKAKVILEETEIVCDCLLLLSGTKSNELVVIERTPRTSSTRMATDGFIIVTNDYKAQTSKEVTETSILSETSCKRYDTVKEMLHHQLPLNVNECFDILNNEDVKMNITVQQMVFNSKLDLIEVE